MPEPDWQHEFDLYSRDHATPHLTIGDEAHRVSKRLRLGSAVYYAACGVLGGGLGSGVVFLIFYR